MNIEASNVQPLRLQGRRLLLTGAASGIGKATAELFAAQGAALALIDIQTEKLTAVAGSMGATALSVDLRDAKALAQGVEDAAHALGGLDGVVNCAGITEGAPLCDLTLQSWMNVMTVNLTAPYLICKSALPWLQRHQGSTIVNVASASALVPTKSPSSAYCASKGGLISFGQALAIELAPAIRVNTVCPGFVETPMTRSVLDTFKDSRDVPFLAQYALNRAADPREIARAILFLTSADSSFVTGSTLAVDGGRTFH